MRELKKPIISFKDFSFQYRAQKKPTLTGINLDIYPGERVLIAGPSGSLREWSESILKSRKVHWKSDGRWCGCTKQQYF